MYNDQEDHCDLWQNSKMAAKSQSYNFVKLHEKGYLTDVIKVTNQLTLK